MAKKASDAEKRMSDGYMRISLMLKKARGLEKWLEERIKALDLLVETYRVMGTLFERMPILQKFAVQNAVDAWQKKADKLLETLTGDVV